MNGFRAQRLPRGLLVFAVALVLAGGCRDESPPVEPSVDAARPQAPESSDVVSGAQRVGVVLTDSSIESPGVIAPGPTVFEVRNAGTEKHSLGILGPRGEVRLQGTIPAGGSGQLEVIVEPGMYSLYCPVRGHEGLPVQFLAKKGAA